MPRHEPVSDYRQELLAKILNFLAIRHFISHAGLAGLAWDHIVLLSDVWRNHSDSGSTVKDRLQALPSAIVGSRQRHQ